MNSKVMKDMIVSLLVKQGFEVDVESVLLFNAYKVVGKLDNYTVEVFVGKKLEPGLSVTQDQYGGLKCEVIFERTYNEFNFYEIKDLVNKLEQL